MASNLTVGAVTEILGRDVEEIHLTIAKSNALGLDSETIAGSIGVSRDEIDELMATQDYKDVRLLVGSEMLRERTERDGGWDGIESIAVQKLTKRVTLENDTETLLKIATLANRATRRTAPPKETGPLDPSQVGARIPLTLTRRFTEKLNTAGDVIERSETQQISVLNGSAVNPKFEDVKQLLSGREATMGGRTHNERSEPAKAFANQEQMIQARQRAAETDESYTMQELLAAAKRAK